jgi:HK97 family phage prohead protease
MLLNKIDNPLDSCQLKFDGLQAGQFEGYASTFGNVDSYGDTILKGAFSDTLEGRSRPVRMFYGHSPGRPIGIWKAMAEDGTGLRVKGELTPGHTDAENVYASMKHGAIDGLSIGFRIPPGGSEEKEEGGRVIKQIDLVEVSVVSMPAEGTALVESVKSEIDSIESIRDAELFLRDAGNFPRSMAKALISQLRPLYQREADTERELKEAIEANRKWLAQLTD